MTKEENERKKEGKQQHIRNKEWNRMQAKTHAGFEKVPKTHKKPNKSNQIKTKTRKKENEYKIIFPRIKPKINSCLFALLLSLLFAALFSFVLKKITKKMIHPSQIYSFGFKTNYT